MFSRAHCLSVPHLHHGTMYTACIVGTCCSGTGWNSFTSFIELEQKVFDALPFSIHGCQVGAFAKARPYTGQCMHAPRTGQLLCVLCECWSLSVGGAEEHTRPIVGCLGCATGRIRSRSCQSPSNCTCCLLALSCFHMV